MTTVSVRELKAKVSQILRNLEHSEEEIIITRRGKPCAKLVPVKQHDENKKSLKELRGSLKFLPADLEYEAFQDIKKVWEPRPLPTEDGE